METLTIRIPNGKSTVVSKYIKKIGGEVLPVSKSETDEDNEVTHEVFFGENIKRLIKAFKN